MARPLIAHVDLASREERAELPHRDLRRQLVSLQLQYGFPIGMSRLEHRDLRGDRGDQGHHA